MSISDMSCQSLKSQWLKWLCLALVLLFNFRLASAEAQNLYTIDSVAVNASGSSPTKARVNAIASGQREAFITLLDRLEIDKNFANSLKDDVISDMVASQQILDEKISGNNYSATLNLTFSESFVKHYLGNKTEVKEVVQTNNYLVVPIKLVKNQPIIWKEDNDWKLALEKVLKDNKISSIKLPRGDLGDIAMFNYDSIKDGNISKFEEAINKYKVEALVLAYFEFDDIENKVNISLQIIHKFQSNKVRLDFVNVNQLSMPNLIYKVANKTAEYIINSTNKVGNQMAFTPVSVSIDVLISNLGDWLTIKNKLENANIISDLKVNSISKDLVKITVVYNGSNGDITNFFSQYSLSLQKKAEGGYFLSKYNQTNEI